MMESDTCFFSFFFTCGENWVEKSERLAFKSEVLKPCGSAVLRQKKVEKETQTQKKTNT